MMESERSFLIEKCGSLLHLILVDIRHLSWDSGNEKLINELADIAHNLPLFMLGKDDVAAEVLRGDLLSHAKRRWPQSEPESTKYVELWDMDDEEYQERHRKYANTVLTPEPVGRK